MVYVRKVGVWHEDDFREPSNRMVIVRAVARAGPFLSSFYRALNSPRTVVSTAKDNICVVPLTLWRLGRIFVGPFP